ncbi:transcription regulator [Artemisia annua]|uniref:Transcription regulator n=1 Tax=Artemisia annua TaxID=35608 RepID=A0A2U1PTT4_ARTAN|nr:transcription regulator [Artemisia annua]
MSLLSLIVVLADINLSLTVSFFSQIDLLAEISQSPRILSEVDAALKAKQMKTDMDEYLKCNLYLIVIILRDLTTRDIISV